MDRIAELLDGALVAGLGSAAAISVGDAGVEVVRLVRGHVRRAPDVGPAIDDHTPFDVASLTKPMATAEIAHSLVADGKLALDAPIRRWFPAAASTGTVRDLLAHTAGCVAHVELFRWLRSARPAEPRAALVGRAAREPCAVPGERVYSDLGFILLGAILELVAEQPLAIEFDRRVARPLHLAARFAVHEPIAGAVATELDDRGLVCGLVHDENAYWGGRACGHAGLFASLDDVARFAAALVEDARAEWLGWDVPSTVPGVSHAGERWPRERAVGHLGFTGTSLWLDLAHRRWVALLTNRVHPTRHRNAEALKALRRAIGDVVVEELER